MAQSEKVQIDYNHKTVYDIDPQNQVGTDADFLELYPTKSPLRTVPTPSGTTYYVKKFGIDFVESNLFSLSLGTARGSGVNIADYKVYGYVSGTWTLLGTLTDDGTPSVVYSSTAAFTKMRIDLEHVGGTYSNVDADNINMNLNGSIYAITVSGETLSSSADDMSWYVSRLSSPDTYYDEDLKYGGYRGFTTGSLLKPDHDIATAYARCGANDGVCILDSETYDEDLTSTFGGQALDTIGTKIFSIAGQSPKITNGTGVRTSREVSNQYYNTAAIYFNENGNDANTGTWQLPKLTIANAITNRSGKHVVYGGDGATVSGSNFNENNLPMGNFILEADYGYMPTISNSSSSNPILDIAASTSTIRGINFVNNNNITVTPSVNSLTFNMYDCTIKNAISAFATDGFSGSTMNVQKCIISNSERVFNAGGTFGTTTLTFEKSKAYDITHGFYMAGTGTIVLEINDNYFYNNIIAIFVNSNFTVNGNIKFNTFVNSINGIALQPAPTWTVTTENNIFQNISGFGITSSSTAITVRYNCFWINDVDYNVNVTSNNELLTDPKLVDPNNNNFAISSDSSCYAQAFGHWGPRLRIIEIDANDIEINGVIIDGQDLYNIGICIIDGATITGALIKWNSVKNCNGISIDVYSGSADSNWTISNNKINNNGDGVKFNYGGNTLQENAIYSNVIYSVYSDYTGQIFNHNAHFNNGYGIRLGINSSAVTVTNSIFDSNTSFGIYSEVGLSITYCDINNAVNGNVDISDNSNITDNPLFVNGIFGSEDLRLKRKERGDIVESKCLDASDGIIFSDIGSYDEDTSVTDDSWKKYTPVYNPTNMDEESDQKSTRSSDDIYGNIDSFMADHKIVLPFVWGDSSASTKEQFLKIKYLQNLIPSSTNDLLDEDCEMRIHLVPTTFYGTGTGTIDATEKTITDSSSEWVENEKKGWNVSVKFKTGTGATVSASGKTLTKTGDFTGEDWTGFYLYMSGHYFYIISNTDNVLTLSDPNGYLLDKTAYAYTLTKYFNVESNTETILTITDDNSDLTSGSYDYFFDFILCKVIPDNINTSQPYFDYLNFDNKNGYGITFEGID